jgi:hypothetical protein
MELATTTKKEKRKQTSDVTNIGSIQGELSQWLDISLNVNDKKFMLIRGTA